MCNANKAQEDSFYTKFFARFYDPFMAGMEEKVLIPQRKKMLKDLTGNILEVGSGTGINFPLYNKQSVVIASEPSKEMISYAENRLEEEEIKSDVRLVQAGVGDELLEKHIPSEGLDAIVCTLVLCTIPKPEYAVESFKKWLKPSGKLIVLEHIQAQHQPRKTIHNLLNPFWKHFAEGCHLTRQTDQLLKSLGFKPVWERHFTKVIPFYQAVMVRE